jgi:hypothetical protein
MVLRLAEEPGRNPRMARAILSSFVASNEVRDVIQRHMREGRRTIAEVVAIGQRRGEIDKRLNKDQLATQLLRSFLGTVLLWSLDERPALRRAASNTFANFWRSVAAPGKGKKR